MSHLSPANYLLVIMVRLGGLEPPAFTFGVCYSIRLSYRRKIVLIKDTLFFPLRQSSG